MHLKGRRGDWKAIHCGQTQCVGSTDPTADGDSITNREHADLNPRVGSESLVKLKNKVSVVTNVLPHWCIRSSHDGTVPQRVVVADHSSNFHKIDQTFMVVDVVVLVSINEYKVIRSMVLLLHPPTHNKLLYYEK